MRTAEIGRTHALQYAFAAYLRDPAQTLPPAGIEQRRLDVYAELIFNNVESLLSSNFPVIRTLYDETGWRGLVRAFLRDHQAHTPHFPEIGREFIDFVGTRHVGAAGDPPFLPELAHYEWAEIALAFDPNEIDAVPHDAGGNPLSGVPVVSPLAWIFAYRFPVHRIRADWRPDTPPDAPTVLLLVRNRADTVRFIEINPLTQLLLERLQENTTASGLACLDALLAELAPQDAAATLRAAGIDVLRDLQASEAILGTVPD